MNNDSTNRGQLSSELLNVVNKLASHPEGLERLELAVELAEWTYKLHSASAPCGQDEMAEMDRRIESLRAENKQIRGRLDYLENDLHAENDRLRDENSGLRQEVDYSSEDYCSKEDSSERKYLASGT